MTDTQTSEPAAHPAVVIFAPLPVLTVTVEDRSGEADIHVHAGGQGVWQSRMVSSLGVPFFSRCFQKIPLNTLYTGAPICSATQALSA